MNLYYETTGNDGKRLPKSTNSKSGGKRKLPRPRSKAKAFGSCDCNTESSFATSVALPVATHYHWRKTKKIWIVMVNHKEPMLQLPGSNLSMENTHVRTDFAFTKIYRAEQIVFSKFCNVLQFHILAFAKYSCIIRSKSSCWIRKN